MTDRRPAWVMFACASAKTADPRVSGEEPRYLRGQAVAAGGMGTIHEARQTAMGRKVAMKVMLHAWHERSVGRFLDEARITGMLSIPTSCRCMSWGWTATTSFFTR